VGILWDKDPRFAKPLIDGFAEDGSLTVGDNAPYLGTLRGDTLWTHATTRGLAAAIIEYRQDLVGDPAGARAWADRTEALVKRIRACATAGPPLRRHEQHGSKSDDAKHISRAKVTPLLEQTA
jgi:predicted N-formylglutamate amidohydrolase